MHPAAGPFIQPPKKHKSYWFWWVCLGFGMLSCVGFVIAAFKIQTRRFVVAAVVAVLASTAAFAAMELFDPGLDSTTGTSTDPAVSSDMSLGVWIVIVVWAALVIYALILQPQFKRFLEAEDVAANARWHEARAQNYAHYPQPDQRLVAAAQHLVPPPASAPTPAAPREEALQAETDRYLAAQPGGNTPPPAPPNAPTRYTPA